MNHHRVHIFEKEGQYGILIIDYLPEADLLGNYSSKTRTGYQQVHDDPMEADRKYQEAIQGTIERGWKLVYSGDRMFDLPIEIEFKHE